MVEVVVGAVKSGGRYARAELVIKAGGRQVKFGVELSYTVKIQFNTSNREAAEEAAAVLKEAGGRGRAEELLGQVSQQREVVRKSLHRQTSRRPEGAQRSHRPGRTAGRGGGGSSAVKKPRAGYRNC